MPLKAPGFPPVNQADWDRWTRATAVVPDPGAVTTVTVADRAITDVKLRDSVPASVIGRLQGTPGPPADIAASADDRFLVRRTGALTFGLLADADIPDTLARDSEVTSAIATATATILATTDTRYVALANVLNGSATYDPPSLLTLTGATTTVTVTGAAMGDFALASFSLDLQGITLSAYVSASSTVSVRLQNDTAGTLDLASGTLRARVWKQ